MKLFEHEAETIRLFGQPYTEVHNWLDEFAGKPGIGMKHRKYRHHMKGIEEAGILFGAIGAEVARAHIVSDLMEEGWVEGLNQIPKDEADYDRMGLY